MASVRTALLLFLATIVPTSVLSGTEGSIQDRVEVGGGAVLLGQIERLEGGSILLKTDYAGTLQIDVERVERITLAVQRELSLPPEIPVFTGTHPNLIAPERIRQKPDQKPAAQPAEKPSPRGWSFEGGINVTGKQGNSERLDLAIVLKAEYEREQDRTNLYSRYAYGTNRGVRSVDEVIVGARYTSFVFDETGLFIRQETELDDFEGIRLRSTSAIGVTRRVRNVNDLRIEARAGISYRYENYVDDGSEDFPGMDLGVEVDWRLVEWARFRGTYTFLPSIKKWEDFIIEQDSGFNIPLDDEKFWKLRFGLTTQYNNAPDHGREKLDLRYYARLIASWE